MTTTTAQRPSIETLNAPRTESQLVPIDQAELAELREAAETQPRMIAVLSGRDVQGAAEAAQALQRASIQLTYPEDWVMMRGKDGAEVCFLQDSGCQRVTALWGITFASASIKDCVTEVLEDANIAILAPVSGKCLLTGEEADEIGFRASNGFFAANWEKSQDKPADRARIKADILKAALANGRGRLVRRFTGMSQVPLARLREIFGENVKRVRSAEFQPGTRGGSGSGAGASDPQRKLISGLALKQKKVTGLSDLGLDFDALVHELEVAPLTGGGGGTASALIKRLQDAAVGGMTLAEFEQATGLKLVREPGGEG